MGSLLSFNASAQLFDPSSFPFPENDEKIRVDKLAGDELSTTFLIQIKESVAAHYHANHSETVTVLQGEAEMTLGADTFELKPGHSVFIPKGTAHSVRVNSKEPLVVISVQAPAFDGSDRIFIEPKVD